MHEPRGGERLAAEARDEARVLRQVLGQQLHGHVALQPRVERELHRGHAADPEPAFQAIAVCEEGVGGHPSPGGTPPEPGGSSVGPSSPPVPGSTVGSGVTVGFSVGLGVGVSRRRLGRGRRLGRRLRRRRRGRRLRLGLALLSRSASSRCATQSRRFALQRLVGLARQRADLLLGVARRALRGVALAGRGRGARVGDERGDLVGLVLGDERVVLRAATGEHERAQPGREQRGAGSHRPSRLVAPLPESRSLAVLEALGERVGQPRGPDRGLGAGEVVVRPAPLGRPRLRVEHHPRGPRVAVARLARRAGVEQPLARAQVEQVARAPRGPRGRLAGGAVEGERDVRVADQRDRAAPPCRRRRGTARRSGPTARTPRSGRAARRGRARRPPPRPTGRGRAGTRASRAGSRPWSTARRAPRRARSPPARARRRPRGRGSRRGTIAQLASASATHASGSAP